MTAKVEIQLSEDDMKRLNVVAAHQGNDAETVVWLALRLYLSRFDQLINDNEEKAGELKNG